MSEPRKHDECVELAKIRGFIIVFSLHTIYFRCWDQPTAPSNIQNSSTLTCCISTQTFLSYSGLAPDAAAHLWGSTQTISSQEHRFSCVFILFVDNRTSSSSSFWSQSISSLFLLICSFDLFAKPYSEWMYHLNLFAINID